MPNGQEKKSSKKPSGKRVMRKQPNWLFNWFARKQEEQISKQMDKQFGRFEEQSQKIANEAVQIAAVEMEKIAKKAIEEMLVGQQPEPEYSFPKKIEEKKTGLHKFEGFASKHWRTSCTVAFLLLALFFEGLNAFKGIDIWSLFWKWLIGGLAGTTLLNWIIDNKRDGNASSKNNPIDPKENPLESLFGFVGDIKKNVTSTRRARSCLLVFLLFFLSMGSAHLHLYGRFFGTAKAFGEIIVQAFDKMVYQTETEEADLNSPETPNSEDVSPSNPETENENKESVLPLEEDEALDVPSQSPEKPKNSKSSILLLTPSYEAEFTEKDHNRLFFLGEPFLVEDWSSSETVANCLKPYIQSLLNERLPNHFDNNPEVDQDLVKEVAKVSELEKVMADSLDLEYIIETRKKAWEVGERFDFANLLANDMQAFGNAYFANKGSYKTIKYYYAESIRWSLESLRFEAVSHNQALRILDYISTRYKDIAYVAPAGNSDASYALILENAFAILPDKLDWALLDPGPGPELMPEEEQELIPEDEAPLIIVIDELGNEAEAGEGPESSSDTNLNGNSKNSEDVDESRDTNKMPEADDRGR